MPALWLILIAGLMPVATRGDSPPRRLPPVAEVPVSPRGYRSGPVSNAECDAPFCIDAVAQPLAFSLASAEVAPSGEITFDGAAPISDVAPPLFPLVGPWDEGAIAGVAGEEPLTDLQAIMQRLDRQEEELRSLRRQLTERAPPAPAAGNPYSQTALRGEGNGHAGDEPPADKKADEGWIDLSGEKWNVKLGGHVQMDYVLWPYHAPPIPAQNYFEFRRLRLLADGVGYGVYDFRLQMDFEPEAGDNVATPVTDVKDAYITAHEVPWVQRWRIGNFFVPFGLEQVTNDTNNIFLERSIPTQNIFCGDREVGFATYGVSDDLDTTWTFGAFFDRISESRKEKIDDNQGIRVSGRFTHLPYYDEPSNGRYLIHTGVGLFYTHFYDKFTRFRARPQIHEGPFLIDSGEIGAVDDITANVELATVWGPFSVQSELYGCRVNLAGGDKADLYGYYVYGSYFLTGENRIYERYGQHGAQFGRNVPYSNFFMVPGCCGPGAWELKVRTSYLDLAQLGDGQYQDITAGFNWYWSDRMRVMFEWIHPWTTAQTVYGTTQSDIIGMRLDFNW
jgi:phosphate-selective porin OprO/OprP